MFTITAAEILARAPYSDLRNFYVEADTGASFSVVARVKDEIIVRGLKEDSPYGRVVRTGRRISPRGSVRVRVEFACDLGDAAGTLAFTGPVVGGIANFRLFGQEG